MTSAVDDAGGFRNFPDNYATVTDLARSGELSLRIAYHLFPQTAGQEIADLTRWTETVRPQDGDEWLRLNGAGENLTWAAADFENFAEPRPGLAGGYEAEFGRAVRLLIENGWGFRLHATYDETIRRDLAVFEYLAADGLFPAGNRWLFDHAETVSDESLDRIAALGGREGPGAVHPLARPSRARKGSRESSRRASTATPLSCPRTTSPRSRTTSRTSRQSSPWPAAGSCTPPPKRASTRRCRRCRPHGARWPTSAATRRPSGPASRAPGRPT
ncbi:amidohydrolase family protein [Streptomyces sp. NPDC058619]|uniref:amidohydrolase family protein n=1 Tax=unclassified Streptomyces TaxID=2593676 RepID=UPI00364BD36E